MLLGVYYYECLQYHMEVLEGNQIECSRCENIIELEDAVGLNKSKIDIQTIML